jgi:hypothetical protein
MRIHILLILYIGSVSSLFAQIYEPFGDLKFQDTLSLDPLHDWIEIPDSNNNIWQIGEPQKTIFNSAYQNNLALITDTLNPYPDSIDNCFVISIPFLDSLYGEGILSFYHQFDTDTLKDGCVIEISNDEGLTWTNIIFDYSTVSQYYEGLYDENDTIAGGIPAYSGFSNGWQKVEIYWWWLALVTKSSSDWGTFKVKFRFISDSISNSKDGWIIDNIEFKGYDIAGNVHNNSITNKISIKQNPTFDNIILEVLDKSLINSKVELYDITGKLIEIAKIDNIIKTIDINEFQNGIYILKLLTENNTSLCQKIFKK